MALATMRRQPDPGRDQTGGSRCYGTRYVLRDRHQFSDVLQVACKVRRHGCAGGVANEGAGGGERPVAQDVRRGEAQGRAVCGCSRKK